MLKTKKAFKSKKRYDLLKDCPKFMLLPKAVIFHELHHGDQAGVFQTPERPSGKNTSQNRQLEQSARLDDMSDQPERLL